MSVNPPALPAGAAGLSRREALKLLASGIALAAAGCSAPAEEIVPYVDMPEGLVPGEPRYYATALALGGYARGVICTAIDGRPIKVEGNPRHPFSLGRTDLFAQAAIMGLYDPDRAQAVTHAGQIANWEEFGAALVQALAAAQRDQGAGLRVLSGTITSPTLLRQIAELKAAYPGFAWHAYEPTADANAEAGASLAFGRPLRLVPRLGDADVVLTLDADPLGPGPLQIVNGHGFGAKRTARREHASFMRLYAVESTPTTTGASSDHRLTLPPHDIAAFAQGLAHRLGAGVTDITLAPAVARFADAAAVDLKGKPGHALVLAGSTQPLEIHALAHWINAALKAPVDAYAPSPDVPAPQDLPSLVRDMRAGKVRALLILDANPVYDAPADLGFGDALKQVAFSAQAGLHRDETGAAATWHLPLSHELESWGDLAAPDGTVSVVQPLIRPLYDTRSAVDILAMLAGQEQPAAHTLVQQTWRARHPGDDFDDWWRKALHDGLIAGSAPLPQSLPPATLPALKPLSTGAGMSVVLRPDPSLWDGRFANNAWLQECPKPMTTETWGNSVGMSPADAATLGIAAGDMVEIAVGQQKVEAVARLQAGHAAGVASLTLGYGRDRAGTIGTGIGASAYRLRTTAAPWLLGGATLTRTGDRGEVRTLQQHFKLEGEAADLFPGTTLQDVVNAAVAESAKQRTSLYPDVAYDSYAWAMVIDTTRCISCNACVIACQSENNVPVVGPEEISVGRDMHWLRIDVYDNGTSDAPQPGFQPVPCMQCEKAPCEPVCPVEASVHDSEGLNDQVYNRCIGTRFCEANCPYKVRRFNFFGYADGQEYAGLGADVVKAAHNPDVSVRPRGVMEKCTYCVQRISRARRGAEKERRSIREGEVVTACQAACPTEAITFGNLNNAADPVNALRREPQHYALLGHLDTRPRTTYLKRIRNPNPALEDKA